MIQRTRLLLIFVPLGSLALLVSTPSPPEANAQNNGQRREEGDSGNRGEGRGGRGGRERFRGGGGENGEGRGQFGGGENGGRRGFMRRGGEGRGGENAGGEGAAHPGSAERPSGGPSRGSSLNMEDYVRGVVKEHDKNGDMMLQADEQKGLSSKAAGADLDKDGIITTNELTTALSGNAPANTPAAASATSSTSGGEGSGGEGPGDRDRGRRGDGRGGRDRGEGEQGRTGSGGDAAMRVFTALPAKAKSGNDSSKDKAETKRTYRFTRGADRLPATGLPSWFKSRDANGDGQVAMSEYGRSWSDRTIGEFRRYDLDNDGIVTAKEAAGK